ncbi:hypothetical protein, partial [Streptomyces sp. NPDC091371]|uniref:hypothetical protein n=1 Tax=Streptomyces sp. NPDC091371 TaxID=3155303 RepID=UPI00344899A2
QKLDKGDQQGIYLAGQNWYVLAGFVWDEGGELALRAVPANRLAALGGARLRRARAGPSAGVLRCAPDCSGFRCAPP